jgi:cellulose synthase/poly-beta-1,6-N-acetylglucosamine synthase-like glycosyltransferase
MYVLSRYSKGLTKSVVTSAQIRAFAGTGSTDHSSQADSHVAINEHPGISVVIAARNEEKHISDCICAIQSCGYPFEKFEVILVDDHSTDNTREAISLYEYTNVRYLSMPDHLVGKKAAITFGVMHACHPIIACTDADCRVPAGWLDTVAGAFRVTGADMITGPVLTEGGASLLHAFQRMDMAATMLLTVAGIARYSWSLANGANMAFTVQFFSETGGFKNSSSNPSGDDIFLAAKAAGRGRGQLAYAAKALPVITKAESSWTELWAQRKRWASKSFAIAQNRLLPLQMIVFAAGMGCVFSVWAAFVVDGYSHLMMLVPVVVKLMADLFTLHFIQRNTGWSLGLQWFFLAFPFHIAHLLHSGFAAITRSSYLWKERAWSIDFRKSA